MATAVIMPRQGQSVESCVITEWHKKKGDRVKVGDILFSYETDKSSFDEKSPVDGVLLGIFAEGGDDVPCLENVCVIGEEGEDISSLRPECEETQDETAASDEPESEKADIPDVTAAQETGDILHISPRARNLALKTGADLSKAAPTGPMGRIIERDVNRLLDDGNVVPTERVERYLAGERDVPEETETVITENIAMAAPTAPEAPVEVPAESAVPETKLQVQETEALETEALETEALYTDVKLTNIRRVIAKSMHASLSTMAQLTLNTSFDASAILAYRARVKARGEELGLANITLNDMVLFACAKTLLSHKDCNAYFMEDFIRVFDTVNLGIAVDTERGLMVPTLAGAEKLSLCELSRRAKALIKEAQSGSISPDKLTGGTITVTNLGSLGIESFTPVINPPQVCILGVNCVTYRPREDGTAYPAMGLSLTFDHRALDGAPAARFLKDLAAALADFDLLLSK